MVPIYDEYESGPGEIQPEEEKEPEEHNISCPEPVNEQPPLVHQPMIIRDI